MSSSSIVYNEHVYETFGISKHFLVKLQGLLIRAKTLDNSLTAKCFIYDVVHSFYSTIKFLYFGYFTEYFNSKSFLSFGFNSNSHFISPVSEFCFAPEIGRASCRERV